ncbi:MAG: hypothetical protein U1D30_12870 [Planctomycetota bacterium]
MNRPDLTSLTDEQLIHASNRGLFNRSRRELDESSVTANVTETDGWLQLSWSDDAVCSFPPGSSLRGGRCTCAALDICRHLVRSCLLLRDRSSKIEEPSDTRSGDPSARDVSLDLLRLDESTFVARYGQRAIDRARRRLVENIGSWKVNDGSREVQFSRPEVRVHFPLFGNESSVSCSCREPQPCSHLLPALLLLRGETPSASPTSVDPGLSESRRHSEDRLYRLLQELLRVGLDGLSPGWLESARSVTIELEKVGLTKPAYLLSALEREVAADSIHSGRADPNRRRWLLAALFLRLFFARNERANEHAANTGGDDLVTELRARYWDGGPRAFLALGCSGWWTDDLVGMTVHLMDEQSQEIVTVGTARPRDTGSDVARLAASIPILGEFTTRELLSRRLECSAVARSEGKVRLAAGGRCVVQPELLDWRRLAEEMGLSRFSDVARHFDQHFPTIRTLHRPDLFLFVPASLGKGEFQTDRQYFHWDMTDDEGFSAPMILRYRNENVNAIRSLERLALKVKPKFVLGQAMLTGSLLSVRPITLIWYQQEEMFVHNVDLDRFNNDKRTSSNRRARNAP